MESSGAGITGRSAVGPGPSFRESFRFPLESPEGRRDVMIGGLLFLLTGPVGFVFCMGHRLHVLRRLTTGESPAFYGFRPFRFTFVRGLRACCAIAVYLLPGLSMILIAALAGWPLAIRIALGAVGAVFFLMGLFALPGGMTYNAVHDDMAMLFRPDRAFSIALSGGRNYLKAWAIGWSATAVVYASLLLFVIPYFFVSPWAWSAAGHAFTVALVPESLPPREPMPSV